jgi:xylulokinase
VFGADHASIEARIGPGRFPTGLLVYPLVRVGERLPFIDAHARGFVAGRGGGRLRRFGGYLEGVAGVERWIFDEILSLGGQVNRTVFATGGATAGSTWMRIRASMLDRELVVPARADSAFGACIAAARPFFGTVAEAAGAMVRIARRCRPEPAWVDAYAGYAARLREACERRGMRVG